MSIQNEIDLSPMTGEEVRALRKSYGLTTRDMADMVGVPQQTWSKWEHNYCPGPWAFLLRELEDEAVEDISPVCLTGDIVREIRETLFGTGRAMAEQLGLNVNTVYHWTQRGVSGRCGWGRALVVIAGFYGVEVGV